MAAIPEEQWSSVRDDRWANGGGGGGGGGAASPFPARSRDGFVNEHTETATPPLTPSPPRMMPTAEVYDDRHRPYAADPYAGGDPYADPYAGDPYAADPYADPYAKDRHAPPPPHRPVAHAGGGGGGYHDEWSTVVYPSDRNVVPEAMPIGHGHGAGMEAQYHRQPYEYDAYKKGHAGVGVGVGVPPSASVVSSSGGSSQPPPNAKTIPMANTDPAPELVIPERKVGCSSRFWASFSRMVTFFIPDCAIRKTGPGAMAAKQAWREKVATCLIALCVSVSFVGGFGFMPLFLCGEDDLYTWQDIYRQNNGVLVWHREAWTVIHGSIYNVEPFVDKHSGGSQGVVDYLGRDASRLFPRTPAADIPSFCRNPAFDMSEFTNVTCEGFGVVDKLMGTLCHDFAAGTAGLKEYMGEYHRGSLAYSIDSVPFDFVAIKGTVYNVSGYLESVVPLGGNSTDDETSRGYLAKNLHILLMGKLGQDATDLFEAIYAPEVQDSYQRCLDELFYAGAINDVDTTSCATFYMIMFVLLILVCLIMVLQTLCSMLYVARKARTLTKEMLQEHIMVMVPCYNEGDKELRKTINSVVQTEFPDDNKVIFVVADGLITGRGESISTPETVARILGFSMDHDRDAAHFYRSIGANERNRAFVYHGVHKKRGRELKYVVVVKCGTTSERATSARAGNRGKRDSQLILLGCLNRISYGRELCELDVAICRALNALDISMEELKYLMTIDADTRVHKDSMGQMIFSLQKNESILALCGETRVDNKAQSWVTMVQVYEYYSSHHLKKAFESVFGCVTCLPGCFTMYRIKAEDDRPLIACDYVYGEYSRNDIESLHEKNLYHLGEDRMLTTLLLQFFSDMRLSFVPEAICWTIVPHTFKILLSQRRRWINSTFHNMWELLKVNTMCGICVCSMKTIVIADMMSVMILPASVVYAVYFVYLVLVEGEPMSQTLLMIYAITIGCQVVVFLVRSRFDYIFWFIAYFVLGIPLFYFLMPIYAFWNMDDLSWGSTRQVSAKPDAGKPPPDTIKKAASKPKGKPKGKPKATKPTKKAEPPKKKVAPPAEKKNGSRAKSGGSEASASASSKAPRPNPDQDRRRRASTSRPTSAAAGRSSRGNRSGTPMSAIEETSEI